MAFINLQDTDGTKTTLLKGQLGYDDYTAGGDAGRVYVGTGTENIALAKLEDTELNPINIVFEGSITEEVAVCDLSLEPDNGTVQTYTATGDVTFTDGLSDGQFLTLILTNGGFTITFPTLTWWNAEPTLGTTDKILFEKIDGTLYGTHVSTIA
jgi:hypothetical protein